MPFFKKIWRLKKEIVGQREREILSLTERAVFLGWIHTQANASGIGSRGAWQGIFLDFMGGGAAPSHREQGQGDPPGHPLVQGAASSGRSPDRGRLASRLLPPAGRVRGLRAREEGRSVTQKPWALP